VIESGHPSTARILVIRPDHLGDLLFTTPALRLLRQRYPDAHIAALVGPWGAPVLANNPHVDDIITLPFPGFSKQQKPSPWQPYRILHRWARKLRGKYHEAFVLRFDHWWGALLAYLAGVPQRVGYAIPEVAPFLSHAVPYTIGRHEVEQNLRLVDWKHEGIRRTVTLLEMVSPEDTWLEFRASPQAIAWARDLLGNPRPIAIHPGAGAPVKLWRVEGWAAAADALASETASQILLTGSHAERPLCGEIATKMKTEARVLAGETTLDQLAAILGQCQLVLGLDSGPLHLATAMGTPTVHLYGPVDRDTFGPWGSQERHRTLVSDWPCIPCNRLDYSPLEVENHPCVREIGTDALLIAARQALAAGRARHKPSTG
jgi:heptosyltransferase-2/heptosyltransferase-3